MRRAFVVAATACTIAAVLVGCTHHQVSGTDTGRITEHQTTAASSAAQPAQPSDVSDWRVGPRGGTLTSGDGSVSVKVKPGDATAGTTVRIVTNAGIPSGYPQLAGLASLDITPLTGKLVAADVSVKLAPYAAAAAKANPAAAVALIDDHHGHWAGLPTSVEPATGTIVMHWPHFSHAIVGTLLSPLAWFRDHVLTYELGPKKNPSCKMKDAGFTFATGNGTGGHMDVPPLDGCADALGPTQRHRLNVTNRYWYAFRLEAADGTEQGFNDVLQYSSLQDTIIGLWANAVDNEVLVPGHSRADMSVADHPEGNTTIIQAHADTSSYIISAVLSIIDLASLGEGKLDRAALESAEKDLWDLRAATDSPTIAEIAEKTADP